MDKRLQDLDDVDSLLKQRTEHRAITKRRNGERYRARKSHALREIRIERGIITMPAIIVVLICLVLLLEPWLGVKDEVAEISAVESTEAVVESEESTEETAASDNTVHPLEDTVLMNFFQRYFESRLSADVETLNSMSGLTNQTEEQKKQLASQLKVQAGYIEKYENLRLNGVQGLQEDELLVFLQYDVKFRRAETAAPSIMYCYMKKTEDGGYQLIENRSPEQVRFINSYTTEHPEVQELINAANSQLLEALSTDSRLAVLYDAFQTGRIYTDDQSAIDSEVSLISVETEAETTAAERSTESARETETERQTRETKSVKSSTEAAQPREQVVEAADPGQGSTPASPVDNGGGPAGPAAPGDDVIEAAENPGA